MWDTRWEPRRVDGVTDDDRVMEGHEVFGPLQLRRIDWQQEMFRE